jgi:hypothetical protein
MRGYGQTDAPAEIEKYTLLHVGRRVLLRAGAACLSAPTTPFNDGKHLMNWIPVPCGSGN